MRLRTHVRAVTEERLGHSFEQLPPLFYFVVAAQRR
jgi:hypothetical protein